MTTEEKAVKQAELHFKMLCNYTSPEELIKRAYRAGYLAGATEALASQWKDPKVELPEIPDGKKLIRVLAWVGDEPLVCWYTCHGRFITTLAAKQRYSYNRLTGVKVHLSSEREDVTEIATAWLHIPPMKGGEASFPSYESALSAGIAAALELIEKKGE